MLSRGAVVARTTLDRTPRPTASKNGLRGLFSVGPQVRYVLATDPYFAPGTAPHERPSFVPVPTPSPSPSSLATSKTSRSRPSTGPLLRSISMPRGIKVVRERHLCRLTSGAVGCSGFTRP